MQKMKATVFHGPNDIRVEEVPGRVRERRSGHSNHTNDYLRNRSAYFARRISGEAGTGDWT